MIHFMKKYILLLLLVLSSVVLVNGQIVNSKGVIGFSAGKVFFGGPDNLFFPKGMSNNGLSFRIDYLRNILPWLKVGLEGSYVLPGATGTFYDKFVNIASLNERIVTCGINGTIFLPFRESGWRNRFRFQFGVAPVFVAHSGQRTLTINDIVLNHDTNKYELAVIEMGGSSGFGLSVTPAVEYKINQRIGLRLSWNTLITSLKSELTTEQIQINSMNIGIIIPLSRIKQINY